MLSKFFDSEYPLFSVYSQYIRQESPLPRERFLGGLRELLNETFRHLKWGDLVRADLFFTDRKYHCQVQNIPAIRFGLILPVIEEFAPCPQPTDVFLHLLDGRKLYFKYRRLCYSNPQSRLNEQAEMTFYEVVGRNLWTPRPFYQ